MGNRYFREIIVGSCFLDFLMGADPVMGVMRSDEFVFQISRAKEMLNQCIDTDRLFCFQSQTPLLVKFAFGLKRTVACLIITSGGNDQGDAPMFVLRSGSRSLHRVMTMK